VAAMLKMASLNLSQRLLETVTASIDGHPAKLSAVTSHHGNPHSFGASYLPVLTNGDASHASSD
jgi:hypothetical protein